MTLKRLCAEFSISGQIAPADIPGLAKQGFRAVVCNRPDGEAAEQPPFREIAAAAEAHGLQAVYIPMTSPMMVTEAAREAFQEAWPALPKPVLGYCKSG